MGFSLSQIQVLFMGRILNAVVGTFAVVTMLFVGMFSLFGGFLDLNNMAANYTVQGNVTRGLMAEWFAITLPINVGLLWTIVLSMIMIVLIFSWRYFGA